MILKNSKLNEKYFKDRVIESDRFINEKIKHNQSLSRKDLRNGQMVLVAYSPKDKESPYDRNPLILIISRTSRHVLGLNIHWCPPQLRTALLQIFFKSNRQNIKYNRPLVIDRNISRVFWKIARPIFRKYIISRISRRGVIIKPEEMAHVVTLNSARFIGINSITAWHLSIAKLRKNL